MSSDEDYLFDETDDRDSGNESPEDEEDWGMDIGLGKINTELLKNRGLFHQTLPIFSF